ncbi:MAG: chorismate mutase [Patescibacteria group bacterium]|nr:chorismate mutase [Patescibacteria group bacterium]
MLKIFRKKIDKLDSKLLKILRKRAAISSEMGEYKKSEGIPVVDDLREEKMMKKIFKKARKLDLDEDFIEDVFERIIEESRRLQG